MVKENIFGKTKKELQGLVVDLGLPSYSKKVIAKTKVAKVIFTPEATEFYSTKYIKEQYTTYANFIMCTELSWL
jgi:hypothetical protein